VFGRCEKRIDTHISHVFLYASHAVKMKRAVTLPFVDQGSVEKRRRLCFRELEINRRFAPEIYLEVIDIVAVEGGFQRGGVEGDGEPVLVMRRFAERDLLDNAAREGRLSIEQCAQLGERIAALHDAAPANTEMGHEADYKAVIEELARTELLAAGAMGLATASTELHGALSGALTRAGGLIERRRRAGRVRRGHGDLHLRNLCFWRGAATPFDALEFDERLATTDVIYDLAFLLMDLRRRGLDAHANAVMNAYWDSAGEDEEALSLLPFFMALRATVLVAVRVQGGDLAEASGYRRLALRLLAHDEPCATAVGGLSGAGKSVLARRLAPLLGGVCGARLIRSDIVRRLGDGADYSDSGRDGVYAAMEKRARAALCAGASVVLDATFTEARWRRGAALCAGSFPFRGLWLHAPEATRLGRVSARRNDASEVTVELAAQQTDPDTLGDAWTIIEAGGGAEETLRHARKALGLAVNAETSQSDE